MLGMTSVYDKESHTILSGEIGAYVARLARESRRELFVNRYEQLGVFCICEWLSPAHDVFIDIMNLGTSLSGFTRARANELNQRLFAPLTAEATSRAIAEADSDYHHGRMNDQAEETERLERCARGE